MELKRSTVYIMATALFTGAFAVMQGCAQTEKTEAVTAEITAAQMEGRNAARLFLHAHIRNDQSLKTPLETADSLRRKYSEEGKKECAEAFDSVMMRTVRYIRPDLAPVLESHFKTSAGDPDAE